jgi:hypothetical protein
MSLLRQVLAEIYSMFAGDAVMSACTLAIVAIAVALHAFTSTPSGLIGFGLLAGCVVLLVVRVTTYVKQTRL